MAFAAAASLGAAPTTPPDGARWALAIHGGAGTATPGQTEAQRQAFRDSLAAALAEGRDRLARGDAALDVVEGVVARLEDDPLFNAGKGAVFNAEGAHELDAAIMDGATLRCGAVAGLTTVRHPIALARLVMERTSHVFLAGPGAERFADEMRIERVPNSWFDTPARRESWEKARAAARALPSGHGTVGAVALDGAGRLAAATSTGGLTNKRWGRIGDVPVIGAGTYADARVAISATGKGEEFIRHGVARSIAGRVALAGESLDTAVRHLVFTTLAAGDGGVIAVGADGATVLHFNTETMLRGAADSGGRFEVAVGR